MWTGDGNMKTSMERVYPLVKDMHEQEELFPDREYVFFYDDGQVYRAFLVDRVKVYEKYVEALAGEKIIVTVPGEASWRLIHKSNLEFVNGATMEQIELIGSRQKQDLKEKMLKKLGLDKEGKKVKRTDSKIEGIPLKTGQYA